MGFRELDLIRERFAWGVVKQAIAAGEPLNDVLYDLCEATLGRRRRRAPQNRTADHAWNGSVTIRRNLPRK
ncbi:MAG TPA: hypothetical protein VGY54_04990 [Polyangiaceae bacterium]|nr:hypothetical protein [Polyangiaceae bacterium]